jgi:hypothetical protein
MKLYFVFCVLAGSGVLTLSSCRQEAAQEAAVASPDTVAMVGKVPLLQKDLDHAVALAGGRPAADVLTELTREEALAQLAAAGGLAEDPSVRAAVRRLLAARLREKHEATATVDPAEVAAALEKEQAQAPVVPPHYQVAFLRQQFVNAGSRDAAVGALEKARADFLALPADPARQGFGALAATVSDDADTRYQGGDAGWISQGKNHVLLPRALTDALTARTEPGLLPGIIESSDAAWLGLVMRIKTPEAPRISPAQVEARLLRERETAQAEDLIGKALAAFPVTILKPAAPANAGTTPPVPPTPPG